MLNGGDKTRNRASAPNRRFLLAGWALCVHLVCRSGAVACAIRSLTRKHRRRWSHLTFSRSCRPYSLHLPLPVCACDRPAVRVVRCGTVQIVLWPSLNGPFHTSMLFTFSRLSLFSSLFSSPFLTPPTIFSLLVRLPSPLRPALSYGVSGSAALTPSTGRPCWTSTSFY